MTLDFLFIKTSRTPSPNSSQLINICLRTVPFNIIMFQAHAPTSDYYVRLWKTSMTIMQEVIDQILKKTFLYEKTGMQK